MPLSGGVNISLTNLGRFGRLFFTSGGTILGRTVGASFGVLYAK